MMVAQGVLTDPDVDVMFALHIEASRDVGSIGYRPGGVYASVDDFRIVVHGRQSHGAYPWNSVDPIVTSAQIVNALQTIVSRNLPIIEQAGVVTVGSIHGGVRSNIIPEEVELIGTIRALDPEHRLLIHDRFRSIVEHTATSMGATAEIELPYTAHYPVTYNDPDLTAEMVPVLRAVAGDDHVELALAETGAEDFSYFAERVPGFYFQMGGKALDVPYEEAADHHTPDFVIDDSGLGLGVRAFTALTLHYMNRYNQKRE